MRTTIAILFSILLLWGCGTTVPLEPDDLDRVIQIIEEIQKEKEANKPPAEPTDPPVVEEPPPAVDEPIPAPVTVETAKIHSTRNPPFYQYYFYKDISMYPRRLTISVPGKSWDVILTGRTRIGYVGKPGVDGPNMEYIVKNSEVSGRGLTVLIHERYGRHERCTIKY